VAYVSTPTPPRQNRGELNSTTPADGEPATIISIEPLEEGEGYGPMCGAWRVRGAGPLPVDYADTPDGTLLSATVAGIQTAWGDDVPAVTANRTLYNTL